MRICSAMRSILSTLLQASILLLLAGASQMFAVEIEPGRKNEFLIARWTTEDGLPQNTVTAMVQTRDGYIWVSTFGGLARFDGIRFTVFDSARAPKITSNRILSLFEDSKGTLWIGSESGEIFVYREGSFEAVEGGSEERRINVWGFEEDLEGSIYVSSDAGVERITARSGAGSPFLVESLTQMKGYSIKKDASRRIWVRVDGAFKLLQGDRLVPPGEGDLKIPDWSQQLGFGADRVLSGTVDKLTMFDGNGSRELMNLDVKVHENGYGIAAFDGRFWFQQAGELYEIVGDKIKKYDLSGFVKRGSRMIYRDREGNIWLATQTDGLVRLTRRSIRLLSDIIGEEFTNVFSLVQDKDGTVWFANSRLYALANGFAKEIPTSDGQVSDPAIRSLAIDDAGTVWGGGARGLYRAAPEGLVPVPELKGKDIKAMLFDEMGRLWIGSENGVGILERGKYSEIEQFSEIIKEGVHCLYQGRDGTVWIGGRNGLIRYRQGEFVGYGTADGLSAGFVRDVYEDGDGTIWIATYGGGINRLKNGRFASISTEKGLKNNALSRILVDGSGRFWLLSNIGVQRVTLEDLNRVADGAQDFLGGAVFGTSDGMTSSEANGGLQPAGMVARDGSVWFPMLKDVVIIDPGRPDKWAPIVKIESASSKSSAKETPGLPVDFDPQDALEIENGLRNLEISYTGLSFTKPESLRFFYKMEGLDEDWIDAGSRRTAFYPYLPPGSYRFTVKALGTNGLWSEETADLRIDVAERFWESRWFALLLIILGAVAGFLFYRSRVRRHEERQKTQKEFAKRLISAHELERRRMAAELHDGLGQNLLLIKNWASMAMKDPASGGTDYISRISETAADSLEETRSIVQDLSPQNLKRFGLTDAILSMVEQLEDATGVIFETDIHNIDGLFGEEAEISLFRIVQEGLTNIAKHSESPSGRISIIRSSEAVMIEIADEGKGFAVTDGKDNPIGFGLMGITQRVNLLGGEIDIRSEPGKGTRIIVTLGHSNET